MAKGLSLELRNAVADINALKIGKFKAENKHGGYCLFIDSNGFLSDFFGSGIVPKKELTGMINAFNYGYSWGLNEKKVIITE